MWPVCWNLSTTREPSLEAVSKGALKESELMGTGDGEGAESAAVADAMHRASFIVAGLGSFGGMPSVVIYEDRICLTDMIGS